jgi:hypothetical protein
MKTFAQLADDVKPNGGNAVEGVSRINQANVGWTYRNFMEIVGPLLGLKQSYTAMIGSAGKKAPKETSGDIDIAVEIPNRRDLRFDIFDYFVDELTRKGYTVRDMRSIGIISLAYPIMNYDDKQEGEFVQIDLMIVDSVEYAQWGYYSPHHSHSEYKGLYRNEINFFIAKHAAFNPTLIQDGAVVEWERYWFSTSSGLLYGKQTLLSAKTNKITKTPRVISKTVVTNDPDKVARFLYGQGCDSAAVLTLEDSLREMKDIEFPYSENIPNIIADTIAGIQKKGYPVPDIIRDFR